MNTEHIELNRPVHLARRDVFFERAVELLHMPLGSMDTDQRINHLEKVKAFLGCSEEHGVFGMRSSHVLPQEKDFVHFIKLVQESVISVLSMIQHLQHIRAEEGFLGRFLRGSGKELFQPAQHYERRADDIMQGLWQMLRLSHVPYQSLHREQFSGFSQDESRRYRLAETAAREEAMLAYAPPLPVYGTQQEKVPFKLGN